MIIEGAFLKLPELLLGKFYPKEQYEATLNNYLAMAVLLELSARNIQLPMDRVHIERPYPQVGKSKSPGRADLYVDLTGIFAKGLYHSLYGMKTENWIESKFFGGIGRQAGNQTKVENAAKIALDLLRLCLFVQEDRSAHRDNARYLVVVFNRDPDRYLAFHRRSPAPGERKWLRILLQPGENHLHISAVQEPASFRRVFGNVLKHYDNVDMQLRVVTRLFSPIDALAKNLYWGYLVRIIDYEIIAGEHKLVYKDTSGEIWSEQKEKTQKRLIQTFQGL